MNAKTCKHYLHRNLSELSFRPTLSVPSSQDYKSSDSSDTYPLSVYLGKQTIKYSFTRPPSPPQIVFHGFIFVMSTLQYNIVLRETYKFQTKNIIFDTASKNIRPLCRTYFYVNGRKKLKCKNIFIGMVTHFKNNSQWARYMTTLILTVCWNYCTQSYQCSHALPRYISKS